MKILSLHFENINSLAGEWTIRFDDPAFVRNRLFAISGPTGSGKTSVLDAISLALYGKTPRQENVADKKNVDVGAELVMTAGTGNSFSEVEFESSGLRYKAVWRVHRGRNSADGALQPVERKLLFEENGVYSARDEVSKNTEVQRKIEEIVGLNFSQFTRAVLLPQGGFDSFLKSKRDEKAAILEKLSGQEIYRSISIAAYRRNKKENERLAQIQRRLSEITLLSENEANDLAAWLANAEKTRRSKDEDLKKYENAERILKDVVQVENSCRELRTDVDKLSAANKDLDVSRKRLSRDDEAQKLIAPLESLEHLRKDCGTLKKQRDDLLAQLPQTEMQCRNALNGMETKRREEEKLREENKNREELRGKVSSLDSEIDRIRKIGVDKKAQLSGKMQTLDEIRRSRVKLNGEKSDIQKKREQSETYISAHPTHKMLESQTSAISDRLSLLDEAKENVLRAKDALAVSKTRYADSERNFQFKAQEFKNAEEERNRGLSDDMNKIALFLQSTLVDGERCPVCGSPFHSAHISQKFSPGEVSATADRLNHMQRRYEAARKDYEEAEYQLKSADDRTKASEKELAEKTNIVSEQVALIAERLRIYGFSESDLNEPKLVLSKIRDWAAKWKSNVESIDKYRQQLSIFQERETHLDENEKSANDEISVLNRDLDAKRAEVQKLVGERQKLFGTVDVAEDRRAWQEKIELAASRYSECMNKRVQAERVLGEQKARLEEFSNRLAADEREKDRLEIEFQTNLRNAHFASENDLRRAVVSKTEREMLQERIRNVESELSNRQGQLLQAEGQLKRLRQNEIGHETLQTVRSKIETLAGEIKSLAEEIQTKQRKSWENAQAKKAFDAAKLERDSQEKVVEVWSSLNDLIGSADGKKFVEYVQRLTLRNLVEEANKHLRWLDPRYTIETENAGMNISLHDSECGTSRLAANLSGGESFLISLSLALGLSSLASQRVRIDTLFLDEGFGSLDERKLQRAIELLHRLGERGDKLVGVISHVNRLKEEISNHIEVIPTGSGRSKLAGPGVSAK